eukprot:1087863-Rhodomonas_salina.1
MTNQMNTEYKTQIQNLQKRIDKLDSRLMVLEALEAVTDATLQEFTTAISSLQTSFETLSGMFLVIIPELETKIGEGLNKAAALVYVFHDHLEKFDIDVKKCEEETDNFEKIIHEEPEPSKELLLLVKLCRDTLQPIKKCRDVLKGQLTYNKNGDSIKRATKQQMIDVYDLLVNQERIEDTYAVIDAIVRVLKG